MKIFEKKLISASVLTLLVLTCVLMINNRNSYALPNLGVPEITSFSKSPVEEGALKVEFKSDNVGSNFSYELLNATTDEVIMLSGSTTTYTYQSLEPGEYKVQIRVCVNDNNNYSCSDYSPQKIFELKEEEFDIDDDGAEEIDYADSLDSEIDESPVVNAKLSTKSYVYNGKVKTPAVTVTEEGEALTKNEDYKVTYPAGRKNIGGYTVTVTGIGDYKFSFKLSFVINPPSTTIKSKTAKKTSIKVIANSKKGGVKYQFGYKKSSAGSYKTVNSSSTTKTISGLTKNTKYNLKVRTYKVVSGKTYYSAWSKASSLTTKK